jgi:hypothetical protein
MGIAYNTSIVTNGLVLCFDPANSKSYPGSGTVLTDLSENKNVATLNGTVPFSSGSFTFNGTAGNHISDAVLTLPILGNDKTILCWTFPDSTGPVNAYTGLVALGGRTSSTPSDAMLLCLNTNAATWYVGSAYWANDYNPSTLPVIKDAWNMVGIIGRSAPTANNTKLICGNSSGLTSITGSSSAYTRGLAVTNVNLTIGCTDVGGGRPMKGKISVVLVYNRELSDSEIQQNFNALRGRYGV